MPLIEGKVRRCLVDVSRSPRRPLRATGTGLGSAGGDVATYVTILAVLAFGQLWTLIAFAIDLREFVGAR